MYKSPIEIELNDFVSDYVEKVDEYIVKCVQKVVVNVDKDELIKALGYDRGQYEKGWNDRDNEIVRCKDCKNYWDSAGMCCFADMPINDSVKPEDYCSRGERGADETNRLG